MAITPEESLALLIRMRDLAAAAPPRVAVAIAKTFYTQVERELRLRSHVVGTWTNSPPGDPPALVTGRLAGSVLVKDEGWTGAYQSTSSIAPHTVYASVQEYGATIFARRHTFMKWIDDRGAWFKKEVHVPERPYMRAARDHSIADGSLSRSALEAFQRAMDGLAG